MVWTNAVGAVFTAALLSVSDRGAMFVFPETGQTNLFAWAQLSPETTKRIQQERDFVSIPPALAATWVRARMELQRADDLLADGRMTSEDHVRRHAAIFRAFSKVCTQKGVPTDEVRCLQKRLHGGRK